MEKLSKTSDQRVAYEVWRKSEVGVKTRTGEMRVIKKMKLTQKENEANPKRKRADCFCLFLSKRN